MDQHSYNRSIWDLDPREVPQYDYADFDQLFRAAHRHAFPGRISDRRIRAYVQRYLRFRVVPPWVREYAREVLHGEAIANIAEAPLDPAIDWRLLCSAVRARLFLRDPALEGGEPDGGRLSA